MATDFITNDNVERFLSMLRRTHLTSEKRTTLQKLLVEEEDKLARSREHLELSERRVMDGKDRIAKLETILARRPPDDPGRQRDEMLLATMTTTQELLEEYNCLLRNQIFPYCIMLHTTMVGTCTTFDEAKQRAQHFSNANPKHVVTIVDRSDGDSQLVRPE